MTPVEPAVHEGAALVIFAENQPEYLSLPASVDGSGCVMTEWEPTYEELERLLQGGRIRLWMHSAIGQRLCKGCGQPRYQLLSPLNIEVIEPDCGLRENTTKEEKMSDVKDPRTPTPGTNQPPPPDNSEARPAPGGAGTGTSGDPANSPAAQPRKQ